MVKALNKQRKNIVQKQVAAGKEFKVNTKYIKKQFLPLFYMILMKLQYSKYLKMCKYYFLDVALSVSHFPQKIIIFFCVKSEEFFM